MEPTKLEVIVGLWVASAESRATWASRGSFSKHLDRPCIGSRSRIPRTRRTVGRGTSINRSAPADPLKTPREARLANLARASTMRRRTSGINTSPPNHAIAFLSDTGRGADSSHGRRHHGIGPLFSGASLALRRFGQMSPDRRRIARPVLIRGLGRSKIY
jgi:hypothetical protein